MDDDEFRLAAVKRAPLLAALNERPMTMGQLDEHLSVSRSTIHRALVTFEEQGLVRKTDQRYALTGFGRTVAERTYEFTSDLAIARDLDEFLNAVGEDVDVPMEHFRDAEVIRPGPHTTNRVAKRILDLLRETDSIRMFSDVLSPLSADVAHQEMLDGMDLEVVFDERIVDLLASEYVEGTVEAFRTGRFEVYVGSDVPFELFLYDDGMAMTAHDHSALPRMFVETSADAAVEWGEELYRSCREDARWFDPDTLAPGAESDVSHVLEE